MSERASTTHPAGDRTLVMVSGTLGILTEQALDGALREVLSRPVRGWTSI